MLLIIDSNVYIILLKIGTLMTNMVICRPKWYMIQIDLINSLVLL